MANVQELVELGRRCLDIGDLESLCDLADQAQSQAQHLNPTDQHILREAVSQWIAGASLLRAQYLRQLKRCQSAGDARKTYQLVSTAE